MIRDIELLRSVEYRRKLSQCVHCGLCLSACPTYAIFGLETDGPRGRIALMRAAAEGRISLEDFRRAFAPHIMLCLACRACETACPSGVRYGELVETARLVVEHNRTPGLGERLLRWVGMQLVLPRLWLLKLLARLLWLYQVSQLQRVVRALHRWLPKTLRAMDNILPPITPRYYNYRRPVLASGMSHGRLLFFTGCIQEAFLSQVNQATLRVLQRNGYEVHAPTEQTCCGAPHLHLGDLETARQLARRNIDVFLSQDGHYEAVICNAGGCGTILKEYPHLLADDPKYAERARRFAALVKDVSEFLAEHLNVPPRGEIKARATYADSCHLRHGQKVVSQPRKLLKSIPGLQLVELQAPDRCCGSAGVYNIAQVDAATAILDAKMADIAATGADLIVTTNTGCHMQLLAGVRRAGLSAQVMHLVEVLDLSYRLGDGSSAATAVVQREDAR
ncbi:MAG: heterodisulfide reductase-related iron-sulfur binding cluster [Anaerolineae bacterium]|nr:heterodisulfide reductase-related iron-sulfur binding cluster [Anaerolineae bacterium]MDW8072024.1 heterodisulfide reductase-related iron-sulfur binding cluster [Anaerolineae bacterium]